MVGPTIIIVAPFPFEMNIPASLTTIAAPVALFRITPPVVGAGGITGGAGDGGRSLIMIAFCSKD
jgi:hypothetical protein